MKGTTVMAVRHNGKVAMASDGQVTLNDIVVKHGATKIRKLYDDKILAGFAGSVADAFTLFERFEGKLRQHGGNLMRSAVELAKDWRTDKMLRRLEAMMIVANKEKMLLVSGNGEVIEPDDEVLAIGSGGGYALAAARALKLHGTQLDAKDIARTALTIASKLCIYTNDNITIEEL